jgi:hypothetical protein
MYDFDNMPAVSSDYKEEMYNKYGLKVTNRVSDPQPSFLFQVSSQRKAKAKLDKAANKAVQYSHNFEEINAIYNDLGKIKNAMTENGVKRGTLDIFKDVNAVTYGRNPHKAIRNWQKAINTNSKIIGFDIESLGDMNEGNIFTPTEISFYSATMNGDELSKRALERSFIVAPNRASVDNINELFDKVQAFYENGRTPMLSDSERRTLGDLIKYSNGAEFVQKNSMTELGKASNMYKQFVTDGGQLKRLSSASSGKKMLALAREGLGNLQKYGKDASSVAQNLSYYLAEQNANSNAFFMGHNIENFDNIGLTKFMQANGFDNGFKPKQYIDTLDLANAFYSTPLDLQKLSSVDTGQLTRLNSGHLKMENLTKVMGFGNYTHSAADDTRKAFNVVSNLFFSQEGLDHINKNILSSGGDFSKNFNISSLKPGDELFSTAGAMDTGKGPLSFVTAFNDGKEVVDGSKFYISSHTKYRFVGSFRNKDSVGVKLQNAMTGENVYVNKSNEKELRQFIYSKFDNAAKYSNTDMQRMYMNTRNDIARSKFRQMTNNISFKNYKNLQATLKAYNLEKAQGRSLLNNELDEIFSYTDKSGSKIIRGNWKENYRRMRGRLTSDAPILDKLVKEVEALHGGDKENPNYWPVQKRHAAVVNAYQEMQKDFGKNKDIINLKSNKAYGIDLLGPDGRNTRISLARKSNARRDLRRLFNYTESTAGRNFKTADGFFIEVLDSVKDHASQYQKNMANKDYEGFMYRLDEIIRPMAKSQDNAFTQINALSDLLVDYRDKIPGLKKSVMEVEGLGARNAFTTQKMMDNVDTYLRKGLDYASGITINHGFAKGLSGGANNSVLTTVRALDEALQKNYMALGVKKEFVSNIPTMESSLNSTIRKFGTAFSSKGDIDLGFELFNTGTVEKPQVSMAIFKQGSDDVLTLDALKANKNAAIIDIPLVNADQYIHYGNQKKISPLALLYRDKFSAGADIKTGTSFSYMMHELNGEANSMIKAAQEGDFRRIEMIANGKIQKSLGYLSGSNKYVRDAEKMYSSTAEADFLKKGYVLFRGVFENQGEQVGLDGETLYPSKKFNMFADGSVQKMIKNKLGIDASLESTRGAHAVNQFFLSSIENRNFVNFGMYNSPGRDNMIQMRNKRTLSKKAIESIQDNINKAKGYSGLSIDPLLITQSEQFLRDTDNAFAKYPGVNVSIANVDELEGIEKLKNAFDKSDKYTMEGVFGKSPANFPSFWENQAIVSQSFADSLHSVNSYTKDYKLSDLDEGFINKVKRSLKDGGSGYRMGYMEQMGPDEIFKRVSRKDGVEHFITGFNINDGKISFKFEENFSTRAGVTKLFLASEKVTVRNIVPDEIMKAAFGEGVHVAGNINHAGHQGYGEVAEGLIKESINKINHSNIDRQIKQEAIQEVQDIVDRTFGLATTIKEEGKTGSGKFRLVINNNKAGFKHLMVAEGGIDQANLGLKNIDPRVANVVRNKGALSIKDLRTNLNNIKSFNLGLKDNILNLEAVLAQNSEDINFMSVGGYGKKGVKVGPRHIGVMMDKGYTEYARWLKDSVLEEAKQANRISSLPGTRGLNGALEGQSRAMELLARAARGEGAVPDGSRINEYTEVLEELSELREGGTQGQEKGLFSKSDLTKTVFDPEYRRRGKNGLYISLPEELEIEFGNEKTGRTRVKLNEIFLSDTAIEMSKKKNGEALYSLGEIGRAESDIFNAMREYNTAVQNSSQLAGDLSAREAKEKALRSMKTGIKNYYNAIFHQSTSSHGQKYNRALSARFKGSGRLNLQIMSPALEIADEVNRASGTTEEKISKVARKFDIDEKVIKKAYAGVKGAGYKGLDKSNAIYISRDRAKDMLKGLEKTDKKQFDNIMSGLEEGKGMPGMMFRSPVIHTESAMPVEYRIDDELDYDTVRISSTMAAAQFGDSDGDRVSFVMAYNKQGVRTNAKKMEEEVARVADEMRNTSYNSKGPWVKRNMVALEKDVTLGKKNYVDSVFETIESNSDFKGKLDVWDTRQMTKSELENYATRLSKAKLTNATYTGMINNLTDEIKRLGKGYATSDKELVNFASGLGLITQEAVSGKHSMTKKSGSSVSTDQIIKWVREGKFSNFEGMMDLSPEEIQAMNDVHFRMRKDANNPLENVANKIFLSEKVAREVNVADYSMIKDTMVDSLEKEMASVYTTGPGRNIYKGNQNLSKNAGHIAENGINYTGNAASEFLKVANTKTAAIMSSEVAQHKAFGPMAAAGLAIGGAIMGAGAAMSTQPLPMDYMNNPAMNAVSGAGSRQPMMDMNSIQNIVNNQGMDIIINGNTTIDKDVNELAGVVSQSVGSAMNIPVNINVNASDNRGSINQSWIEDRILAALE